MCSFIRAKIYSNILRIYVIDKYNIFCRIKTHLNLVIFTEMFDKNVIRIKYTKSPFEFIKMIILIMRQSHLYHLCHHHPISILNYRLNHLLQFSKLYFNCIQKIIQRNLKHKIIEKNLLIRFSLNSSLSVLNISPIVGIPPDSGLAFVPKIRKLIKNTVKTMLNFIFLKLWENFQPKKKIIFYVDCVFNAVIYS